MTLLISIHAPTAQQQQQNLGTPTVFVMATTLEDRLSASDFDTNHYIKDISIRQAQI